MKIALSLRVIFIALIWLALGNMWSSAAGAGTEALYKPWPRVIKDIPEPDYSADDPPPVTTTYKNFVITVRLAADQTDAGSGGRIFDLDVRNKTTGKTLRYEEQYDCGRILEMYGGYPQFECWGRGGGGTYGRTLVRVENGKYVETRTDLFTEDINRASRRDISTTLPAFGNKLYFTETSYAAK